MKILHVTSIFNPSGNGVAVAVGQYLNYESKFADVALYNVDKDLDYNGAFYNFSAYKTISSLPNGFDHPDIVVFNEVYKPAYIKLYKECIRKRIPYVIIPHGCLVKKAQCNKKLKKVVANALLFGRFIKHASLIQYLNAEERDNSVFKHKSIISGNGIEISSKKNKYINKDFVYIGRYDIKTKGLDMLVDMIAENKDWFLKTGVKVKLYGRNSGQGYETLRSMILQNDISTILDLNGPIYADEKKKVLLESYAFIQVSRHEGQPMGIMEALSYGLPCVVTYGTSFGNYVNENKCGIGISFDKEELFASIKELYENEELRNEFSKNSSVIEKDYRWEFIIEKCIKEYKELL